jgi:hypothetical protein
MSCHKLAVNQLLIGKASIKFPISPPSRSRRAAFQEANHGAATPIQFRVNSIVASSQPGRTSAPLCSTAVRYGSHTSEQTERQTLGDKLRSLVHTTGRQRLVNPRAPSENRSAMGYA